MNLASLIALFLVLAVIAAGLSRARFPRAPYIVAGVVFGLYVLTIASFGVWAATCWDCRGDLGETRGDFYYVLVIMLSLAAGTLLLGVWLGARMATMLKRLYRTWRELRGKPIEENSDAVRQ